jgi:predicted chitinase
MNQSDIITINALFNKYEINTKRRICAFFAQCEAECGKGERMVEGAGDLSGGAVNRTNLHNWFDTNQPVYGHKYRGAGAIQLTHIDWNYRPFQSWMNTEFGTNDNNIVNIGTEHVAFNYPWHAAAFYWDRDNLNRLADIEDIRGITRIVKGPGSTEGDFTIRRGNYDRWMRDFSI